ncbi:MAG: hypothetical protein HOY71_00205, partial [Nonomuraea sp.]|nr:hypothetical protein [Nonomuraea sp.]
VVGLAAAAATSALALSLPTAAFASPTSHDVDNYSDYWGSDYAKYHLAKSSGWISVDYDDDESNTVYVSGKLWDKDNRSYDEGGKCAYVRFQTEDFDGDWHWAYAKKYCGYPGYKKYSFYTHDAATVRVQVCQIGAYNNYVNKCGYWDEIYNSED